MTFKDFRKACEVWTKVTLCIELPTYDGGSHETFVFRYPWNADAAERDADQPMVHVSDIPHEFDVFNVDMFGPNVTYDSDSAVVQRGLYVSLSLPKGEG